MMMGEEQKNGNPPDYYSRRSTFGNLGLAHHCSGCGRQQRNLVFPPPDRHVVLLLLPCGMSQQHYIIAVIVIHIMVSLSFFTHNKAAVETYSEASSYYPRPPLLPPLRTYLNADYCGANE